MGLLLDARVVPNDLKSQHGMPFRQNGSTQQPRKHMPTIELSLDVKIHNYKEIAEQNSGATAAWLTGVPVLSWIVESKIDSEIVKRVQEKLGDQVAKALQKELRQQGVRAEVTPQ